MFATLASGYPRPALPDDTPGDEVVRVLVAELEAAGLQFLSDGDVRRADALGGLASHLQGFEIGDQAPFLDTGRVYRRPRALHEPRWDGAIYVREWQAAAGASELPVKQSLVGPYTLGRLSDPGPLTRERLTMALADALGHELRALLAAGCPLIQINEDAAVLIGADPAEHQIFKAAHRRLLNSVDGAHLTLAVPSGSIVAIPPRVFYDAPYLSYLADVTTAPENWSLLGAAPGGRGLICGVADARTDAADDREFMAWAGLYAAAMSGRGGDRVGLAPTGSLGSLAREAALAKIAALAEVAADTHARIAAEPGLLDPGALAQEGVARGFFGQVELAP